ncbi:glycosyltransferase family 4 protein [Aquimonas voraii]|uniref:Glycosyltransferase involved in cell wall bisynthesis n=1 Tax=Aquimonas voraii TaxID=265719 RepID=A0A1G6XM71_9GAMM|nr:glycosyltransferase family 1 protein [Aquimonas voraii]SDD79270.1 Glycosyltransferase involved in cell wall bisynthesis [Aquimonas voraii]
MSNARRFSLVTETYPPEVNGVALTVAGLEGGLRALGHAVEVVRPRQSESEARGDELLMPGAELPRYPGLRFGLPAGRRLLSRWQAQRPDAIYVATEGPLGWSAVRAANRLGIPVATGFHTRFDDYASRYGVGFLRPWVFAWMRRFHNSARATLVPTLELQAFLRANGFLHPRLLRRAVDTQLFQPQRRSESVRAALGLVPEQLLLIHVGRIAPEKNLGLAVRAFRALQRQRPDARFVFVGDGPARAELAAANPDFLFTGVLRGEVLAAHFASADLFVFPSLSETFGNVTLEAMASGVATVAFDYGAAREHLRDGRHGAAVPSADEEAYVAAVLALGVDDAGRRQCGAHARQAVAELSPAAVAAHFAALLTDLAERSAA